MTPNDEHVSMFELDLFFATNGPNPAIEEHLAACQRCSAYLSQLAALQASAPPPPTARVAARRAPSARPAARRVTLAAALVAFASVSGLLITTREGRTPAVAVKGSPAVQLLIRRGDDTRPWDGASRVRAGDSLGLRVDCVGFRRVTVAATGAAGRWAPLSENACPAPGGALPFTLLVDASPGRERFAVVFSEGQLDARALDDAIEQRRIDASAWVARFDLDKESSR